MSFDGVVMEPEKLFEIYEHCIELVDRVPPEQRTMLMEIAERLLDCAEAAIGEERAQNAPTSFALQ